MSRHSSLDDCFLYRKVLFEHIDGLGNVEFSDACCMCIIGCVKFAPLLPAQPTLCQLPFFIKTHSHHGCSHSFKLPPRSSLVRLAIALPYLVWPQTTLLIFTCVTAHSMTLAALISSVWSDHLCDAVMYENIAGLVAAYGRFGDATARTAYP
jgi:hypothetical protein